MPDNTRPLLTYYSEIPDGTRPGETRKTILDTFNTSVDHNINIKHIKTYDPNVSPPSDPKNDGNIEESPNRLTFVK